MPPLGAARGTREKNEEENLPHGPSVIAQNPPRRFLPPRLLYPPRRDIIP